MLPPAEHAGVLARQFGQPLGLQLLDAGHVERGGTVLGRVDEREGLVVRRDHRVDAPLGAEVDLGGDQLLAAELAAVEVVAAVAHEQPVVLVLDHHRHHRVDRAVRLGRHVDGVALAVRLLQIAAREVRVIGHLEGPLAVGRVDLVAVRVDLHVLASRQEVGVGLGGGRLRDRVAALVELDPRRLLVERLRLARRRVDDPHDLTGVVQLDDVQLAVRTERAGGLNDRLALGLGVAREVLELRDLLGVVRALEQADVLAGAVALADGHLAVVRREGRELAGVGAVRQRLLLVADREVLGQDDLAAARVEDADGAALLGGVQHGDAVNDLGAVAARVVRRRAARQQTGEQQRGRGRQGALGHPYLLRCRVPEHKNNHTAV